jgi:hypothetical protein
MGAAEGKGNAGKIRWGAIIGKENAGKTKWELAKGTEMLERYDGSW